MPLCGFCSFHMSKGAVSLLSSLSAILNQTNKLSLASLKCQAIPLRPQHVSNEVAVRLSNNIWDIISDSVLLFFEAFRNQQLLPLYAVFGQVCADVNADRLYSLHNTSITLGSVRWKASSWMPLVRDCMCTLTLICVLHLVSLTLWLGFSALPFSVAIQKQLP